VDGLLLLYNILMISRKTAILLCTFSIHIINLPELDKAFPIHFCEFDVYDNITKNIGRNDE